MPRILATLTMTAAMTTLAGFTATTAHAAEGACVIENARFVCAGGARSGKAVMEAMASDETTENLKAAIGKGEWLQNTKERERYRRSVEGERNQARRYADRAFRAMKRRRMSLKDYEEVRATFAKAMDNYEQAILVYRSAAWFSPARDKNAEGAD